MLDGAQAGLGHHGRHFPVGVGPAPGVTASMCTPNMAASVGLAPSALR